ncbi:MAG: colanic acid biosynthesis acetyltransferase WcaF [Flavobacteriales bacterium]|nr:colanic acid biosynthesis acetyltransferase WcaF [Flavobacteriales bacterium]
MSDPRGTVDLSRFSSRDFPVGAGVVKRTLWYFVNALFFLNPLFPFRTPKPWLLRLFGARVGRGVVVHPGVNIKFPWKLRIGDHVWIGQRVWLDNIDELHIGSHVVISQGALLISGSHDFRKADFPTYSKPIVLEAGCWVGAGAIVTLGVRVGTHAVLSAGTVLTRNAEPFTIYRGNPAQVVGERRIS